MYFVQICKDGYASPCPDFHYVTCNDTYCPDTCTQCEAGYACRGGKRYQCEKGTYSDGNVSKYSYDTVMVKHRKTDLTYIMIR